VSTRRTNRIGVIGPSVAEPEILSLAEEVGFEIAQRNAILVCGGLGGVMEAAARGAKRAGGLTLGILPGTFGDEANEFIDLPLPTGLGEARNVLVVRSSLVLIAIAGSYGTLSEIALALKLGVPVVALRSWQLRTPEGDEPPVIAARSAKEAVELALKAIAG